MNPSPDDPPDYIAIPEHLKSEPIERLNSTLAGCPRLPARLNHVLQYAGIRLLGDLDGKRLSDFEHYRSCGSETIRALRCMILRALHPGVEPDLTSRPIPMGDYQPPEPAIEVKPAARSLKLKDLPVPARLENVLKGLSIERLGQLHGLPIREVLARPNCGPKTVAELQRLLRRVEAGELELSEQDFSSRTPADLLRHIDYMVGLLPRQDRGFLTLRFGATGVRPRSFRRIGQKHGLTGSAVAQRLSRAIGWMRRQGSLKLQALLGCAEGDCPAGHAPLTPALVSKWGTSARPARYSPQFYVRIIAELRRNFGPEPKLLELVKSVQDGSARNPNG